MASTIAQDLAAINAVSSQLDSASQALEVQEVRLREAQEEYVAVWERQEARFTDIVNKRGVEILTNPEYKEVAALLYSHIRNCRTQRVGGRRSAQRAEQALVDTIGSIIPARVTLGSRRNSFQAEVLRFQLRGKPAVQEAVADFLTTIHQTHVYTHNLLAILDLYVEGPGTRVNTRIGRDENGQWKVRQTDTSGAVTRLDIPSDTNLKDFLLEVLAD